VNHYLPCLCFKKSLLLRIPSFSSLRIVFYFLFAARIRATQIALWKRLVVYLPCICSKDSFFYLLLRIIPYLQRAFERRKRRRVTLWKRLVVAVNAGRLSTRMVAELGAISEGIHTAMRPTGKDDATTAATVATAAATSAGNGGGGNKGRGAVDSGVGTGSAQSVAQLPAAPSSSSLAKATPSSSSSSSSSVPIPSSSTVAVVAALPSTPGRFYGREWSVISGVIATLSRLRRSEVSEWSRLTSTLESRESLTRLHDGVHAMFTSENRASARHSRHCVFTVATGVADIEFVDVGLVKNLQT
jgi:hypothetical protein